MWSGPGIKEEEYLAIASLNSYLAKEDHSIVLHWGSLLKKLVLTSQFSVEL